MALINSGVAAPAARPVRVAYEAGPTGFGLARALAEEQIECVVAALSKLIRPAGDRVKTDARDAAHLTRLLRLGEIDQSTRQVGISSAAGPVCHHAEIEVAEGKPNDPPSPAAN